MWIELHLMNGKSHLRAVKMLDKFWKISLIWSTLCGLPLVHSWHKDVISFPSKLGVMVVVIMMRMTQSCLYICNVFSFGFPVCSFRKILPPFWTLYSPPRFMTDFLYQLKMIWDCGAGVTSPFQPSCFLFYMEWLLILCIGQRSWSVYSAPGIVNAIVVHGTGDVAIILLRSV